MASYYHKASSFLLSLICLISFAQSLNNGGATIDLIHRDSPLSPSYDPSQTRFQRLRNAVDRSFSRKFSLLLTSLKSKSSKSSLNTSSEAPITPAGGEYLIEYQIGTPPVRQLSIADTGSDLTWIQCKPCTTCYKQDYPLFDPTTTKSYRTVPCSTNQCITNAGDEGCGDSKVCQYQVYYADQSFSHGDLAADTLTLGSSLSIPNFVFGCGMNNGGKFGSGGSGIFGLGKGAGSLVKQQRSSVHGRFSYCLTSIDSNVSSKISFGNDAIVAGPNVLSTPLVKKKIFDTFYYITLNGFSVGTERFGYKSIKSEETLDEEGNILIDSGTTLTFVPYGLYYGIESSFKSAIKSTQVDDPQGTYNLCYKSDDKFSSPSITAHFEGADLVLPQKSIFVEVEEGIVCLTLFPTEDFPIFGNLHQVDYLIGYDIPKKRVNFLQTDCTKPR